MVLSLTTVMLVAQPGVWTGYVSGWQWAPPQQPATWVGNTNLAPKLSRPSPLRSTNTLANAVSLAAAQQALFSQMALQQQAEQAEAQRLELERARRDAADARQASLQVAQAHHDEVMALERARLESEQRAQAIALEHARQAALEAEETERRARLRAELEAREAAIAERERQRARDNTPGNRIFRWVDAEGVTHYSTKPPPTVAAR